MVKKVQDEDSNSQRDNLVIANIDYKGAVQDIIRIELSDGSFFYVSYEFYFNNSLQVDMEVSDELKDEFIFQTEFIICKKKGLELIARREHSVFELRRKLFQKNIGRKNVIDEVINLFIEKNFLNDSRFASMYIPYLLQTTKCSKNMIKLKLSEKGVDKNIYIPILNENYPDEKEYEIVETIFNRELEKGKSFEKISSSLNMKGFNYKTIAKVLAKFNRQD